MLYIRIIVTKFYQVQSSIAHDESSSSAVGLVNISPSGVRMEGYDKYKAENASGMGALVHLCLTWSPCLKRCTCVNEKVARYAQQGLSYPKFQTGSEDAGIAIVTSETQQAKQKILYILLIRKQNCANRIA